MGRLPSARALEATWDPVLEPNTATKVQRTIKDIDENPGRAMASLDGVTWTYQDGVPLGNWQTMAYCGGTFASNDYGSSSIMTSTNGVT
jgi:hypothetical protein